MTNTNSNSVPENIKWYCFDDQAYLSLNEAIDAITNVYEEFEEGIIVEVCDAKLFTLSTMLNKILISLLKIYMMNYFTQWVKRHGKI